MYGGSRGLALVLGMLWLGVSAGASTIPYAGLREGGAASSGRRPLLVDRVGEDDRGPVLEFLEDEMPSYARRASPYAILGVGLSTLPQLRGFVPRSGRRTLNGVLAGGATRFGRRDFLYPRRLVILPNSYLPGGRFRGLDDNDVYNGLLPAGPIDAYRFDPFLERDLVGTSWRTLRDLVVISLPYTDLPVLHLSDDWEGTIVADNGLDLVRLGEARETLTSFPGLEQRSSFGGRLEFRWDRFHAEAEALGSASAAMNIAFVPEPGSGALLLAGLCALSARSRLR